MNEPAATTAEGAASAGSLESLAALRVAHSELMRVTEQAKDPHQRDQAIRGFLARAQDAGAFIEPATDRLDAQYILDYWIAELISSLEDGSETARLRLATFDRARAGDPEARRAADAALEKEREEAIQLVRLAAAARNWRDSGRDPGYLLRRGAIAQAAAFRERDQAVEEFVAASEAARAGQRRIMIAILAIITGFVGFQTVGVPRLANWAEAQIKQNNPSTWKEWILWTWGKTQAFLPPPDFADSLGWIENVQLPELKLRVANFSRVRFSNANFDGGQFASGSFSGSHIDGSSFKGAELSSAQFRQATISKSSFAGARLYRAVFDRTLLTEVDFSGADLSGAAFWGASFDDKFEQRFKNTAWWWADGWNKCQVKALVRAEQDPRVLKQTEAFRADFATGQRFFASSKPGTIERARALNRVAWTLATWGVDLQPEKSASAEPAANCLTADGLPGDALTAASMAVCIAEKLSEPPRAIELALFRDTHGYLLLQTNQNQAAVSSLQNAAQTFGSAPQQRRRWRETLFRLAVAYYAVGDDDKATAALLQSSKEGYAPSHELWTLRTILNDTILGVVDKQWPAPATPEPCRSN
jgi:hypothetical protein